MPFLEEIFAERIAEDGTLGDVLLEPDEGKPDLEDDEKHQPDAK